MAEERQEIAGVVSFAVWRKACCLDGSGRRDLRPWREFRRATRRASTSARRARTTRTVNAAALPPSPIALPPDARPPRALASRARSALYFVARGDGSHEFSASLEEHNRAVRASTSCSAVARHTARDRRAENSGAT
ncbi:MAG: endolytic transglycosylase MltG [Gammaproteobacteria bacterium]|nr:endolytic transglycosylase MltG [Gammaproteobacteria bacterium]